MAAASHERPTNPEPAEGKTPRRRRDRRGVHQRRTAAAGGVQAKWL
eukprot:CAMPEP_0175551208 /NCGR_PEP_ID=MMETSP0096-20121207/32210_1 /TAXON_ID=311494 /ORGANISM="Alexandrium monilatum, Strain CCMP3105" /LENGTH=45 /DNA_ID= /DNA_START= /DNA_END= /DNA_ORIENTATION=